MTSANDFILNMSNILKIFPDILSLGNEDFFLKRDVNHTLLGENREGKSAHNKVRIEVDHPDIDAIKLTSEIIRLLLSQQSQEICHSMVYQKVNLRINLSKTENKFGSESHYIVVLRNRPNVAKYIGDANDQKIFQTMAGDL